MSNVAALSRPATIPCPGCNNSYISTAEKLIDHALCCSLTGFTPAIRHNLVKHELAKILRRYNFPVTVEPTHYIHLYEDGIAHRPDLLVWSPVPTACDIVITQQDKIPGNSSRAAAKDKIKSHNVAVRKLGHTFFPFALEAHGHEHSSVQAFVKSVMQFRPAYEEHEIMRDIRTGVSVALARARMHSVLVMFGHGIYQRHVEKTDEALDHDACSSRRPETGLQP